MHPISVPSFNDVKSTINRLCPKQWGVFYPDLLKSQ
jgi:hypothetical protein